ncbi:ion transporter [Aquimarina pacifica]|uniref:ion transporter n=1 Tax=Aquimarina pacifica TaxID=1296415 RepID=UPI0004729953|nr:ion transporter [Aquimarina pacifica]
MKAFLSYWLSDDDNPKKYLFELFLVGIVLISLLLLFLDNILDPLPNWLDILDNSIVVIFVLEYLARFYLCSDFRYECKTSGLWFALHQKLKWMCRWSSIIDFLAIIPEIQYFKVIRTFKYLRVIRVIRVFKAFSTIRDIHKLLIILRGMREENRVFYVFFGVTTGLLLLTALGLYLSEHTTGNITFASYTDSLVYALKTVELLDDTPTTVFGKLLSGILLLFNIAVFGFFVSIISNKIKLIMDIITSGKIQKLNLINHTIICGYTKSSQNVIDDLLQNKQNHNQIVLITTKAVKDISGLIYMNADYTASQNLEKVNVKKAQQVIVFAEAKPTDTTRDTDLRTVMTIFQIEKMAPQVHTIAEINDSENAEIIKDKINGDEIIYKELIDARIISNCIKTPHISSLFYALFDHQETHLKSTSLSRFNIDQPTDIKTLKKLFIDIDKTFLGIIDAQNKAYLSPRNTVVVDSDYRLIYI